MKKIGYAMIGVTAALALTLSACNMNTTESKNGNEGKELAEQAAESITARPGGDALADTEGGEQNGTQSAAAENAEAPQSEAVLTFTNEGITASGGSGYEIDGTALRITEAGTYTVTGSCADGSITVKKGTAGVTLILSDLSLSSSDGAALRCNKESGTTLYISGTVTLTDAENPADEDSSDAEAAEAFDGAAVKVKSGASLTVTGSGVLNVDGSAVKNGIKGAEDAVITISGATVNIRAAHNGLGCDGGILITGGALNIQADNDAIHGEADVTISGGTVNIRAGDDAIHAEKTLTVGVRDSESGPSIVIEQCEEGFEAGTIVLYSGSGSIRAADDGVNAAADTAADEIAVYIYGGDWYVNADGDGLDAGGDSSANRGGNIYLYGGTVEVYGSANSGNSALDFDGTFTREGGTLLAVGMSGMAQVPSSGVCVSFGTGGMMGGMTGQQSGSVSIRSGSSIEIKDSSGNTLCSAAGVKSANSVVFADDALVEGESYTLYVDGKAAATASAAAGNGMGGMMGGMGGPMGQTPGQMPGQNGEQDRMPGGMGGRPPMDGQRPTKGSGSTNTTAA